MGAQKTPSFLDLEGDALERLIREDPAAAMQAASDLMAQFSLKTQLEMNDTFSAEESAPSVFGGAPPRAPGSAGVFSDALEPTFGVPSAPATMDRDIVSWWKWLTRAMQKSGTPETVRSGIMIFHLDIDSFLNASITTNVDFTHKNTQTAEVGITCAGLGGGGKFDETVSMSIAFADQRKSFQVLLPADITYQKWRDTRSGEYSYTAFIDRIETPPFLARPDHPHYNIVDDPSFFSPLNGAAELTVSNTTSSELSAGIPIPISEAINLKMDYKAVTSQALTVKITCTGDQQRSLGKVDGSNMALKIKEPG